MMRLLNSEALGVILLGNGLFFPSTKCELFLLFAHLRVDFTFSEGLIPLLQLDGILLRTKLLYLCCVLYTLLHFLVTH